MPPRALGQMLIMKQNILVDFVLSGIEQTAALPESDIILMVDLVKPTSLTTVISVNPRLTSRRLHIA